MSNRDFVSGMTALQDIIIDEEFKRLLPPLDEQTYLSLEKSILDYGCMNPLVLWNNILIDGYNRYEILSKHDLPFQTTDMDFDSRDKVLIWIISTQVSRRNLTAMQLTYFRGLHYNTEKKLHGGDRYTKSISSGQNVHLSGTTANRLSEHYGVTSRTIRRDGEIAEVISAIGRESPDAKRNILSGTARISRKHLRELSSDPEKDISETASKIEAGTFKANERSDKTGLRKDYGSNSNGFDGNVIGNPSAGKGDPIKPGKYRHYKGSEYNVIGFAKHSETLDDMVIYTALYGKHEVWVRPRSMWEDLIEVNSKTVKRFEYVGG